MVKKNTMLGIELTLIDYVSLLRKKMYKLIVKLRRITKLRGGVDFYDSKKNPAAGESKTKPGSRIKMRSFG